MADATKTVSIIFEGETSDAEAKIAGVAAALKKVDDAASPAGTKLGDTSSAIDRLGQSSATASSQTDVINRGLKELGEAAGIPAGPLNEVSASIARIGAAGGAGVAAVAASIVAIGVVSIDAASEAFKFKTQIENLTGSTTLAEQQFKFLQGVVSQIEEDFGETANAFAGFLTQTAGAPLSIDAVRNSFVGIVTAVDNVGGSMKTAEGVLSGFAKAARDGEIDVKELDNQIAKIPNGLNIFAAAMNTSVEGLREMAANGELGKEAIERFSTSLSQIEGKDLTPISSAFTALVNEIKASAVEVGADGAFNTGIGFVEKNIRNLTAVLVTSEQGWKLLSAGVQDLGSSLLKGDLTGFTDRFKTSLENLIARIDPSISKLFGLKSVADELGISFKKTSTDGTRDVIDFADNIGIFENQSTPKLKSVDELLKGLGLNPQKVQQEAEQLIATFEDLASRPEVKGETILAAFEATVKRIRDQDSLAALTTNWITQLGQGKISSDQFAIGIDGVQKQQLSLADALGQTSPKIKEQSDRLTEAERAAIKAEEAAEKFKVKMLELASNEKIKIIEAQVKLDIARVEADAKTAVAAFESVNKTVEDTGKTLVSLFSILQQGTQDWTSWRLLTTAIEQESRRRDEALKLQNDLTRAQIDLFKQKIDQVNRGNALVQIDGAGLQPHLEAFMWEILRTIQVRVNADGLELLTGF